MKRVLNAAGVSLIESLVGLAILSVMAVVAMGQFSFLNSLVGKQHTMVMRDKYVAKLLSDIQDNPHAYQPNFSDVSTSGPTTDSLLQTSLLPIAFSAHYYGDVASCPKCDGRMGYVMRPYYGFPGLYIVTVRVVNMNDGTHKDYQTLVAP